jgi:hypothetical protein
MVYKDFDEAISRLEHMMPTSAAPDCMRVASEVAIALRDAMDAGKRPTALYALSLAGPEVMSTILKRHGRADLAASLRPSGGAAPARRPRPLGTQRCKPRPQGPRRWRARACLPHPLWPCVDLP